MFNVANSDTVQAIRGTQNTGSATSPGNANQIQAIVAPRVVRFGVRVNWWKTNNRLERVGGFLSAR